MFLTITVLALLAVAQADKQESGKITEKRGAVGSSSSASASPSAQQLAYAAKLRQYQQAQALAAAEGSSSDEVRYVPQTTKYTASPVAYSSGAAPSVQYQPQQQAVAYSQPILKQSAGPAYSKAQYQVAQPAPVQHYSLATDVSSFSYSSPIVKYSNLGLFSQQSGKAGEEQTVTYQSAAPESAPAAKAAYYQSAPAAKAAYYQTSPASSPVQTRVQYVPQYESYPQQEQRSAQPTQNYVVASPKYVSAAQSAAPQQQRYIYVTAQEAGQAQAQAQASAAAPQQYIYRAVPQAQYEQQAYQQQPQYERQVYQAQAQAQAAPSVPQAVYAQIPQQYQPQYYQQAAQTKHGIVYAN